MVWNTLDRGDLCKMNEEYEKLREAVARALCAAEGFDPDSIPPEFPTAAPRWRSYLEMADAALAVVRLALREPNDSMIHHGASAADYPNVFMGGPSHNGRDKAQRIWRAMFDSTPLEHLNNR